MAAKKRTLKSELWSSLTHPILRQLFKIPSPPPHLRFEIASTAQDLTSAFQLLHDVYVQAGLMEKSDSGLRLSVYNMLPHSTTLIAKLHNQIVGTATIIRENPIGLPLDECLNTESYKKAGWQVAEVTGLAISPEWQGSGKILFPFLKYIYQFAAQYLKVDAFQIATEVQKSDFFRGLLFFEPISDQVYRDPFINGNLVTALYLNLQTAKAEFNRVYGKRPEKSNLYRYFTQNSLDAKIESPQFLFPKQIPGHALAPILTASIFKQLFIQKSNLVERLSDREIHILNQIYIETPISKLLPLAHSSPPFPPRRKTHRHVVSCHAILEGRLGDEAVTLLDVSESGFRVFSKMPVRLSQACHFRIELNYLKDIPITAKPVWNRRQREWGFVIVDPPPEWQQFLVELEGSLKLGA